jgi:HEAT repeat protein
VRVAAVWAIADAETDQAVEILARVARKDKSYRVRSAAVQALGEIDSATSRKALEELLRESD